VIEQDVSRFRSDRPARVDHTRRQARGLEQLVGVVIGEDRRRRRFHHHGVAISAGAPEQVAADGGEVERRDGVDEPFERAILHLVPGGMRAVGLLVEQLLGEGGVEAPEVTSSDAASISA